MITLQYRVAWKTEIKLDAALHDLLSVRKIRVIGWAQGSSTSRGREGLRVVEAWWSVGPLSISVTWLSVGNILPCEETSAIAEPAWISSRIDVGNILLPVPGDCG